MGKFLKCKEFNHIHFFTRKFFLRECNLRKLWFFPELFKSYKIEQILAFFPISNSCLSLLLGKCLLLVLNLTKSGIKEKIKVKKNIKKISD